MSPLELSRDRSISDGKKVFFERFCIFLGEYLEFIIFISGDHFFHEYTPAEKPLMCDDLLHTRHAVGTESYYFRAWSDRYEVSLCPDEFYDIRSSFGRGTLSYEYSCFFFHVSCSIYDRQIRLEMVIFREGITPSIMCRSNPHDTTSVIHIDPRIRNDRNFPIQDRYECFLPDELLVSFVLWMNRECHVTE